MSTEFGKLNFAVGFNRTSAFPLDANSYFESYDDAVTAAATAAEVGSSDSAYYIGQIIIIKDSEKGVGLYQITAAKNLIKFGQASSAEELAERVSALESRCQIIEGKLILASATTDGFMSKADFNKLAGIEDEAQVNKIESVKINGYAATISDKEASIADLYVPGQNINLNNLTGTVNVVSGIKGDLGYDADTVSSTGTYTPSGNVAGSVKSSGTVAVTMSNNIVQSMKTSGSVASFKEGAFTPASMTKTEKSFATEGSKMSVDEDLECLVIEDAGTDSASYISAFDGGSKVADSFTANVLPTFESKTVGATATFTGDTSTINATFTGTEGNVEVSGEYQKANKGTIAAETADKNVTFGGSIKIEDKDLIQKVIV